MRLLAVQRVRYGDDRPAERCIHPYHGFGGAEPLTAWEPACGEMHMARVLRSGRQVQLAVESRARAASAALRTPRAAALSRTRAATACRRCRIFTCTFWAAAPLAGC